MITALSGSISGSANLTVTAPNLLSIAVIPANASLANGTTRQYRAIGTYSDGSTLDITASAAWGTADAGVAAISGSGLASVTTPGSTTVTATSGSVSGSTNLTVTAAALASIAVTPAIPAVPLGLQQQFSATGTYTDGTTQDVTAIAFWNSSLPAVATVSNSVGSQGLATSAAAGAASISATVGTISGSAPLRVTAAVLVSIAVSPASASIPSGTSQQFTATATMSDGSMQDVTAVASWNSSSPAAASITTAGLAAAAGAGSSAMTVTIGAVSGSAVLAVTAEQLVSIVVSPPLGTVPAGASQRFAAIGTYADGTTYDVTTAGHWSSSNGTLATISDTPGIQGLASALAAGGITITISVGDVTGSATLTVTAAALVSIAVTPAAPSITIGANQQFSATGTYSDGSTDDITQTAAWSSSDAAVAVVSNIFGSIGLATSAGAGTATIAAALGTISGSATLAVIPPPPVSITVSPSSPSISVGGFEQFTATAAYPDGSSQDVTALAAWSSSTPGVASVNASGGATGAAAGSTTITASYAGLSGSSTLVVSGPVLVSIAVGPASPSVAMGGSLQLSATGIYSDGSTADVTGLAQWTSSAPGVAAVGAQGVLTGLLPGTVAITATLGSISGSATATVASPQQITCERSLLYPAGTYVVCYPAGYELDTTLPIMMFLHGGEWNSGTVVAGPTCPNTQSIACTLLNMGYVYYEVDYTLFNQLSCGTLVVAADGQTVHCSTYTFTAADVGDSLVISSSSSGWVSSGYTVASVNTSVNPTTAKLCQLGDGSCTLPANTAGKTLSLGSGSYALTQAGTTFPKGLNDVWCFLDWLGNHAGQSSPHTPGNTSNIKAYGPSAGGWFVEQLNLAPRSAFNSSCASEAAGNWKFTGIMALSPVTDMYNLYWNADAGVSNDGGVKNAISTFLGCIPGQANCPSLQASPDYWAGLYAPRAPMMIIAGGLDTGVPWQDQFTTVTAAATLGVTVPFVLLPNENHGVDWRENCPYEPACGTGGQVWANMQSFFFSGADTARAK
jgi:hypothetical protein